MPSRPQPKESSLPPAALARQTGAEVKQAAPPSQAAVAEEKVEKVADAQTATVEATLTEEDLSSLEDEKKIPYARFKEKVDETNKLKTEVSTLQSRYEADLRRAVEDAELRAANRLRAELERQEAESSLDPTEKVIRDLQKQVSSLSTKLGEVDETAHSSKLDMQLAELARQYPDMDRTEVLGWKKAVPKADLEELAAKSHNKLIERVNSKMKSVLEAKKAAARKAVPSSFQSAGPKLLKPGEEKPKTIHELGKFIKARANEIFG